MPYGLSKLKRSARIFSFFWNSSTVSGFGFGTSGSANSFRLDYLFLSTVTACFKIGLLVVSDFLAPESGMPSEKVVIF